MDRFSRLARHMPWLGIAALTVLVAVPHLAHALTSAISPGFHIIPAICNCNLPGGGSAGAGWGCVLQVVKNLFQFVIFLGVLFCMFGVVYAASVWILSPINAGNREKGREIFMNAVIGLVIVLAAYLLVNTLLTFLTGKTVSQETAIFGTASANCLPTATDATGALSGSSSGLSGSPTGQAPATGNEADVRSQLQAAGVSVNKGACPAGVRYEDVAGGCTSVAGLQPATIGQVENLAKKCSGIVVNGGSEAGHSTGTDSHGNGYKVDLADSNACLTSLLNGMTPTGGRGGEHGGQIYTDSCGNQYVHEATYAHWDVTVTNVCSI